MMNQQIAKYDKEMNMNSNVYAQLQCKKCGEIWDITFKNENEHPAEYVAAIQNYIRETRCPDDCNGKLKLLKGSEITYSTNN